MTSQIKCNINKIRKNLLESSKLCFPRWILGKFVIYFDKIVSSIDCVILLMYDPSKIKIIKIVKQIKKETSFTLRNNEAYNIFTAVKNSSKIEGNIAEVGVYKGGSAKLICKAKGDKSLYLFDTFEGLPTISRYDKTFHKGQFYSSYEMVKEYLKQYKNVYIYKGTFPSTSKPIKNKKFSFVHLDVDIYESTLKSLNFFYPRMNKGGIIISHDYISALGVKNAFDEFFKDKPEPIIALQVNQCLIVKTSL